MSGEIIGDIRPEYVTTRECRARHEALQTALNNRFRRLEVIAALITPFVTALIIIALKVFLKI